MTLEKVWKNAVSKKKSGVSLESSPKPDEKSLKNGHIQSCYVGTFSFFDVPRKNRPWSIPLLRRLWDLIVEVALCTLPSTNGTEWIDWIIGIHCSVHRCSTAMSTVDSRVLNSGSPKFWCHYVPYFCVETTAFRSIKIFVGKQQP